MCDSSKNEGLLQTLAVVLLVILACGAGIFLWQRQQEIISEEAQWQSIVDAAEADEQRIIAQQEQLSASRTRVFR